ncbi:MAG: ABC transporter permease [Cuniculiplasma sp.]
MEQTGLGWDLKSTFIIMKYQMLFYLKTKRFLTMIILVILMVAITVGIDLYVGVDTVRTEYGTSGAFLASGLGFVTITIAVLAGFYGGDATSIETGTNSGYFIMVQPVRKSSILLGRFIGAYILAAATMMIEFVVVGSMSQYIFAGVDTKFWLALAESLFILMAFLALAFFFSSVFKNPLIGILFSILAFVLIMPIIDVVISIENIEPWFNLYYSTNIITAVFAPIVHVSSKTRGPITIKTYVPYVWEANYIALIYLVLSLSLSYIIFRRKEVKPQ